LNPSRPSLRREGEECKISSKVVEGLKAPPFKGRGWGGFKNEDQFNNEL
jgi:hypothetical protein